MLIRYPRQTVSKEREREIKTQVEVNKRKKRKQTVSIMTSKRRERQLLRKKCGRKTHSYRPTERTF